MTHPEQHVDVLIVGSGIMGAGVAARLRRDHPGLRILMVDGGQPIGRTPGLHLHESTDPAIWARYNQRVATGIQSFYASDRRRWDAAPVPSLDELAPGVHPLTAFGELADQAPNSAAAWNVGGMGVHWTAATPRPLGDERFGDETAFAEDLAEAERLLLVHPGPLGPTQPGEIVLRVLRERFGSLAPAGREPRPMPMAAQPDGDRLVRTGPGAIFPPLASGADERFELRPGTLAIAVRHDGSRASGATLRDVATGEEYAIDADAVIVCADTHRTPQLLFASGIRPWALGRFLNVHAFLTSRVLLDVKRFGLSLSDLPRRAAGEFATDSLWLPHSDEAQPVHGQIMNTVFVDDDDNALAYSVGLSFYVPMQSRQENRIVFDERETDVMGMPRMTIEFSHSDGDLAQIERAQGLMSAVAADFGEFDPATESALLPAGSSLHQTGTVRSGETDDGASVCDPSGRVWGFENLFVAGNGVVPTALACNSTLTGMVTAVRAARALSESFRERTPA